MSATEVAGSSQTHKRRGLRLNSARRGKTPMATTAAAWVEFVENAASVSHPEQAPFSTPPSNSPDAVSAGSAHHEVVEAPIVPAVTMRHDLVRRRDSNRRRSKLCWADEAEGDSGYGPTPSPPPEPRVLDERPAAARWSVIGGGLSADYDTVALDIRARLNADEQQQQQLPQEEQQQRQTKWLLVRGRLHYYGRDQPKMLENVSYQAMALNTVIAAIDNDNAESLLDSLEVMEQQHQQHLIKVASSTSHLFGDRGSQLHQTLPRDRGKWLHSLSVASEGARGLLPYAIDRGCSNAVSALLKFGGEALVLRSRSFDTRTMTAKTCLHDAAFGGDVAIVSAILGHLRPKYREGWLRLETAIVENLGLGGSERLTVAALHIAAMHGHVALVEYLVEEQRVPVDLPCSDSKATALHLAALRNHPTVVKSLLRLGASPLAVDDSRRSLVHYAILSGDQDMISICLHASPRPASVHQWKLANPLLFAIYLGNMEILLALLDDSDIKKLVAVPSANLGQTPLHAACGLEGSDAAMCEALLQCGAYATAVNRNGETPLMTAAYQNDVAAIVVMARHFEAPRQRYFRCTNASGHSVWHYALLPGRRDALIALLEAALHAQRLDRDEAEREAGQGDTIARSTYGVVRFDCNGASPDLGDFLSVEVDGLVTTPLHLAVKCETEGSTAAVLKYISPFTTDGNGDTFLHIAAVQGCEALLREYVLDSTTANLKNFQGHSLLHAACMAGSWSCARALLPFADPWIPSALGETAVHVLCRRDDVDYGLLRDVLLARRGADGHNAAADEKCTLRDACGRTALHHLSARNLRGCAEKYFRLFLTAGDRLSACNVANCAGDTPMHECLSAGRIDNLTALLTVFGSDADVNLTNKLGQTPLHLAAQLGLVNAIKPLLSSGAKVGIYDMDGNTVVHSLIRRAAEQPNHEATCRAILDQFLGHTTDDNLLMPQRSIATVWPSSTDADRLRSIAIKLLCQTRNSSGLSAIFYAAQVGCKEMLKFMLTIDGAFKLGALSGCEAPKDAAFFDVTDLAPETVYCSEAHCSVAYKTTPSQRSFMQEDIVGSKYRHKRHSGRNSVLQESRTSFATRQCGHPPAASLVELIVTGTSNRSHLLELTPIGEMAVDYWSPYKFLYLALMVVHIVYMSFFSWVTLDAVSDVRAVLNCSASRADILHNVSSMHTLAGHQTQLAVVMLWPLLILVGDVAWLVNYVCVKNGCRVAQAARKKLTDVFHAQVPMFWLVGVMFSWLSICFYALHLTDDCQQDYVLCATLVSGWIYTIHYTQGIRTVHHFSLALSKILMRDIWQFGIVCVSVLLGYSFGLHALTFAVPQQAADYASYDATLFQVFSWGAGLAIFYERTPADFSDAGKSILFVESVFVTFVIALNIILLNLLIAVMNDSYAAVRERSDAAWQLAWLRRAILVEKQFPSLAKVVCRWRNKGIVTDPAWPGRLYMEIPLKIEAEDSREVSESNVELLVERMAALEKAVNGLSAVVGKLARECDSDLPDEDRIP